MANRCVRRSSLLLSQAHHLLLRHKPSLSNPLFQDLSLQTLTKTTTNPQLPIQTQALKPFSSSCFTIFNHNLFFSHSRSFCSSFEPNPLKFSSLGGGGVNSVVLNSSSAISQGEPVKRKPGRPRKNRLVDETMSLESSTPSLSQTQKRGRGRPPGSGKKKEVELELSPVSFPLSSSLSQTQKRGRGRPPGSGKKKEMLLKEQMEQEQQQEQGGQWLKEQREGPELKEQSESRSSNDQPTMMLLFDDTTSDEQWSKEHKEYLLKGEWQSEQIKQCLQRREKVLKKEQRSGHWLKMEKRRKSMSSDDVKRMLQREQWFEEQREQNLKEQRWNAESQQWLRKHMGHCSKGLMGLRERKEQCLKSMKGWERERMLESLMEREQMLEERFECMEEAERSKNEYRKLLEMDYAYLTTQDIACIDLITGFRKGLNVKNLFVKWG